jgi:hypothetical protein
LNDIAAKINNTADHVARPFVTSPNSFCNKLTFLIQHK